ncbi:MAG: EAL domain-containing protein, partial [Candidatus Competibacteraceae bacterium]|nr:EAL domain-containing protein [Candidatus Competibacteraceae bacterium]
MSTHPLLRLLIVERSLETIETLARTLREAGYVVDHRYGEDAAQVREAIGEQPLDLILVGQDEELPSLKEVRGWIATTFKDIPILALVGELTPQYFTDALRTGAQNVVSLQSLEHLVLVVEKELFHLENRRQVRRLEARLRESEERARTLLDSSSDAIAYIHEGAHVYANPAYLHLFGYQREQDLEAITLMDMVARADREQLKAFLRRCQNGKGPKPVRITGRRVDGSHFIMELSCQPATVRNEPSLQILVRNVAEQTELSELRQRVEKLLRHDPLTGLYNRKYFMQLLEQAHARSTEDGSGGALLYLVITDYRTTVERLGLPAGDVLIRDVAAHLKTLAGEDESVARFSDAAFTILTPASSRNETLALAQRLHDGVAEKDFHAGAHLITTACSVGICLIGESHANTDEIIARADRACETARQMGGDQVRFYTPPRTEFQEEPGERAAAERIRQAIDEQRLELLFQPIASLMGDTVQRFRAFLTLTDRDGQPLSLRDHAPIAERHGLMGELDRWALNRACETILQRAGQQQSTTLFVRLSCQSLGDQDFQQWLVEHCRSCGLPQHSLIVEVSEECAEQEFKEIKQLRPDLHRLGCALAVSHFGRSSNAESILRHLLPDYIKLDAVLFEGLERDEDKRQQFKTLMDQARNKEIQIIADNVTDTHQLTTLWQLGIDLVQGDIIQP